MSHCGASHREPLNREDGVVWIALFRLVNMESIVSIRNRVVQIPFCERHRSKSCSVALYCEDCIASIDIDTIVELQATSVVTLAG